MRAAVRDAMSLRTTAVQRAPELTGRGDLLWIEAQYLEPDPSQPRQTFDLDTLSELAASVQEVGVLTPLRVRAPDPESGRHIITDGERRWRAGQQVGIVAYPCLVEAADRSQAFYEAYLANLHRDALSLVDAAMGLAHIRELFSLADDTAVAQRVHKSVGWVRQMNAVLGLDPETRNVLQARGEPLGVAVGLRPQTPDERRATLVAIEALPSRAEKVRFIAVVNDLRRAGRAIDEAIALAQAPDPMPVAPPDVSPGRRQAPQGRPRLVVAPFRWRHVGDVTVLDVVPGALATTRLAAQRTVSPEAWAQAIMDDLDAFRTAAASTVDGSEVWDRVQMRLREALEVDGATDSA